MTQEDKELLLKDLCARLPYGVKYECSDIKNVWKLNSILTERRGGSTFLDIYNPLELCKPYLFPLSSMTVEQMCKVQNLLPDNCNISFQNQKITFYDEGNIQLKQLEKIFKFFNLYHLDYRGLIEKGLAIDATGKNIY